MLSGRLKYIIKKKKFFGVFEKPHFTRNKALFLAEPNGLNFWVSCTILVISQIGIIELRDILGKTNSQDTAPGILIF
jgi:hypothetical protein